LAGAKESPGQGPGVKPVQHHPDRLLIRCPVLSGDRIPRGTQPGQVRLTGPSGLLPDCGQPVVPGGGERAHRDRDQAGQRDHHESTRLQYGLAERAVGLGWAPSRVLAIDEDLGYSASWADARPGFHRLVSEAGLDHVGIVLGTGMSRLARSGREWHQVLELCALSETLLGDPDGIYDPADHNDRLLLGLNGTISEAELHLIKQRMWSGRLARARRGQLAVPLPAGFVRRPSGEVALDPDEQVQAVVRLIFGLSGRLGTVNAVLCFLADNHIQLGVRLREGPERGELAWRRPSRAGAGEHPPQPRRRWDLRLWPQQGGSRRRQAGGRSLGGCGPHARTGSSSCLGCCPPISASGSNANLTEVQLGTTLHPTELADGEFEPVNLAYAPGHGLAR
jgi:DNA invertase Pin-like site-specific DNA recombinase